MSTPTRWPSPASSAPTRCWRRWCPASPGLRVPGLRRRRGDRGARGPGPAGVGGTRHRAGLAAHRAARRAAGPAAPWRHPAVPHAAAIAERRPRRPRSHRRARRHAAPARAALAGGEVDLGVGLRQRRGDRRTAVDPRHRRMDGDVHRHARAARPRRVPRRRPRPAPRVRARRGRSGLPARARAEVAPLARLRDRPALEPPVSARIDHGGNRHDPAHHHCRPRRSGRCR